MLKPKISACMNLSMSEEMIVLIDQLKVHYGVQARSRVIEMILEDLFFGDQPDEQCDE